MPSTIEKTWAVIENDEIIEEANTQIELVRKGYDIEELTALPKPHGTIFL